MPEGVERRLREASTRAAIAGGQALLVSPYHPAAGFSAGAAMGRNKLIYALADVAVVVSSAEGSGGSWTGAIEALKAGWVPVLVRVDADTAMPAGNAALIGKGASSLPAEDLSEALTAADLIALAPATHRAAESEAPYEQGELFDGEPS